MLFIGQGATEICLEKKKGKGKEGRREGGKKTFLERRFAEQVIGPAVVNEAILALWNAHDFDLDSELDRHADWNPLIGRLIEMGSLERGDIFLFRKLEGLFSSKNRCVIRVQMSRLPN